MTKKEEQENNPLDNWQEKFKEEFGIHFKDSTGELEFAISFISDLLKAERERIIKKIKEDE